MTALRVYIPVLDEDFPTEVAFWGAHKERLSRENPRKYLLIRGESVDRVLNSAEELRALQRSRSWWTTLHWLGLYLMTNPNSFPSCRKQEVTKAHGQIERGSAKAKIRFLPTHRGGIPIEGLGILDTGATGSTIDGDSATVGRFRPLGEANSYTASESNVLLRGVGCGN